MRSASKFERGLQSITMAYYICSTDRRLMTNFLMRGQLEIEPHLPESIKNSAAPTTDNNRCNNSALN